MALTLTAKRSKQLVTRRVSEDAGRETLKPDEAWLGIPTLTEGVGR